jgi:acetate kinase
VAAVAHRIVHGGARFSDSVLLDAATLAELDALCPLAPLHQPHNLHGVRAFLATTAPGLAGLPQIGCFDTGFHATLPREETQFALPTHEPDLAGVRRYGFHGLSYRWLAASLEHLEPTRHAGRWLLCHLGSGASLCALQGGHSIATTMGFSALDGLMMGTRCGALDPGVLLHLLRAGWSADRLEKLLYKDSGLAGVSGISADMRVLRASSDARAGRAIALFTHRVLRESGALVACLGGLDGIVFTGGIGEHDIELRAELGQGLAHLGVHIDAARNAAASGDAPTAIHAQGHRIAVWVIPTDEGRVAAGDAAAWLLGQAQG